MLLTSVSSVEMCNDVYAYDENKISFRSFETNFDLVKAGGIAGTPKTHDVFIVSV